MGSAEKVCTNVSVLIIIIILIIITVCKWIREGEKVVNILTHLFVNVLLVNGNSIFIIVKFVRHAELDTFDGTSTFV